MLKVLLCDDDQGYRALMRVLIDEEPDMRVVGEACDGMECVDRIPGLTPDIVVLDLSMPRMSGLETIPALRDAAPRARIVVLSNHEPDRFDVAVRKLGAVGFVQKGWNPADIPSRVRELAAAA